ncbi:MAG: rhodanese-like domain-containing protein [Planctomycetota bacterium]
MHSAFFIKTGGLLLVVTGLVAFAVRAPRREPVSNTEKKEKLAALYQGYKQEFPAVKDISPEELRDLQTSGKVVIVDGREPEERAVSMIPDAIPLEQLSDHRPYIPVADDLVPRESDQREDGLRGPAVHPDKSERLKDNRHQPLVFYCTAGYRSAALARKYAAQGYDAYNLRKGILGWLYQDFPIMSDGTETNAVHVYGPKWNLAPDRYQAIW